MELTVTVDTNLFYDKASNSERAQDFDACIEEARKGKLRLFFTSTTDFEDRSGLATRIVIQLVQEGFLREDRNAGTSREFMPGSPGIHLVDDETCDQMLCSIWPEATWRGARENQRNDVLHLLAHKLNNRDIFLTWDERILRKGEALKKDYGIRVISPKKLLSTIAGDRNQVL